MPNGFDDESRTGLGRIAERIAGAVRARCGCASWARLWALPSASIWPAFRPGLLAGFRLGITVSGVGSDGRRPWEHGSRSGKAGAFGSRGVGFGNQHGSLVASGGQSAVRAPRSWLGGQRLAAAFGSVRLGLRLDGGDVRGLRRGRVGRGANAAGASGWIAATALRLGPLPWRRPAALLGWLFRRHDRKRRRRAIEDRRRDPDQGRRDRADGKAQVVHHRHGG